MDSRTMAILETQRPGSTSAIHFRLRVVCGWYDHIDYCPTSCNQYYMHAMAIPHIFFGAFRTSMRKVTEDFLLD